MATCMPYAENLRYLNAQSQRRWKKLIDRLDLDPSSFIRPGRGPEPPLRVGRAY